MLVGILMFAAGILIAIYPPLFAMVVSVLLILTGALVFASAWHRCRLARYSGDSLIELILRY
jgi:hypothetical protein|tara:strand:+ start:1367 stop:1552 length:186 start_codon:yes stop_codon:yes gene_type:complete